MFKQIQEKLYVDMNSILQYGYSISKTSVSFMNLLVLVSICEIPCVYPFFSSGHEYIHLH